MRYHGMQKIVTRESFTNARSWILSHSQSLPKEVQQVTEMIYRDYWDLLESKKNSLETLKRLREAMGILPKSEKGSQEKHASAIG